MTKHKERVYRAAEAHTNINTWAAVVTLLEGGHLYSGRGHIAAQRVIKIANAEQQKELAIFDKACAAAAQAEKGKK